MTNNFNIRLTLVVPTSRLYTMEPDLTPLAIYSSPDDPEPIRIEPGEGPHTTSGKTTQISDVVIRAGGEDRDKPTEAKDTPLGHLRAKLTTLQDKLNIFLTERMKEEKNSAEAEHLERQLLDEGVEESSDSE